MSKSSAINCRQASHFGGHAHSGRITVSMHRILPFSTPLVGRKGLNMAATRRPANDIADLTRCEANCRCCCTLERSWSLNVKTRRTVVTRGHGNTSDFHRSLCRLPNASAEVLLHPSVCQTLCIASA